MISYELEELRGVARMGRGCADGLYSYARILHRIVMEQRTTVSTPYMYGRGFLLSVAVNFRVGFTRYVRSTGRCRHCRDRSRQVPVARCNDSGIGVASWRDHSVGGAGDLTR